MRRNLHKRRGNGRDKTTATATATNIGVPSPRQHTSFGSSPLQLHRCACLLLLPPNPRLLTTMRPTAVAATAAFVSPVVAVPSRAVPLAARRRARRVAVRSVASPPTVSKPAAPASKTGKWQWTFEDKPVNIYYEEHEHETAKNVKNILMIPTISDVSTVEEWRVVAKDIVARKGELGYRATIVDWPGLGYSDRPSLNYNADVMEDFLVQLINSPNSPVANTDGEVVVVGGGHAATIAVRAAGKGLIRPSGIAAVAPTWAGPLPIVFGRGSDMETRYGLLRGTIRAPAIGWMMYNVLVSNEKSIQSQYKSHVYANPENVTPDIVESRYDRDNYGRVNNILYSYCTRACSNRSSSINSCQGATFPSLANQPNHNSIYTASHHHAPQLMVVRFRGCPNLCSNSLIPSHPWKESTSPSMTSGLHR
uniref:AB hydrolase-1 domain-containing protein n=1 Tax=Oryza punctata TaxID=4537 RepID=A0A0E0M166_ORYPU